MCLSIPSKVVSIDAAANTCVVDTMGARREVSLDLLAEPVQLGDFLLIHIGYAMNKISKEHAAESLELYAQMIEAIKKEDEIAAAK